MNVNAVTYDRQGDWHRATAQSRKDDKFEGKSRFCLCAAAVFRDDPKMMIDPLRFAIKREIEDKGPISKIMEAELESCEKMFALHAAEGGHYIP